MPYSATKSITVFRTPACRLPFGQGGDGPEEPTSRLHTYLEGKDIEEIRESLEWVVGVRFGTTRPVVFGLAATVLTPMAAFF